MIENIKGVIRFEDSISTKSVKGLMSDIEFKFKDYKEIILYFTCEGGSIPDSRILIDYLNRYYKRIEFVCVWSLASCGMDIPLFFKGPKKIINPTYGMIHLGTNSFDYLSCMDKKSFETFHHGELKRENVNYLRKLKPFLTDGEFNRVGKGEDVYFNTQQLRKIFNNKA